MDSTIVFSTKNDYTEPLQHTLRIWEHHFQIGPQNSYFWGVQGYFLGPYVPKNPIIQKWTLPSFSTRKTAILVQFSPFQVFGIIKMCFRVSSELTPFWAQKKTSGRAKMGLPQFCRISNHFLVLKQHRNAYLALTGPRLCEAFVFLSKNYPKNGLLGS